MTLALNCVMPRAPTTTCSGNVGISAILHVQCPFVASKDDKNVHSEPQEFYLQADSDTAVTSSTAGHSDSRKAALLAAATAVKTATQEPTGDLPCTSQQRLVTRTFSQTILSCLLRLPRMRCMANAHM